MLAYSFAEIFNVVSDELRHVVSCRHKLYKTYIKTYTIVSAKYLENPRAEMAVRVFKMFVGLGSIRKMAWHRDKSSVQ